MPRKIFPLILTVFLFSTYTYSLTWNDITFSAGASTDYYAGEVREIVYPGSGWTNKYLSELIWQIDNVAMLNVHLGASLNKFSLNISAGTAVNKGTGKMDDYDWGDSAITHWTNWSNSDIFLDKSFILDTSLIYSFKPSAAFTIPTGMGYKLNYLNWSDKADRYIYFGSWDGNGDFYYYPSPEGGVFGGQKGINYTFAQNILFITSGLQYTKGRFNSSFNASYSPFIYAWDLDHHIMRNVFFLDTFTSHSWYQLMAGISYSFPKFGAFSLGVCFEELPEVIGNMQMYNEDSSDTTKIGPQIGYSVDGAGLASKILSISIGYTYQF